MIRDYIHMTLQNSPTRLNSINNTDFVKINKRVPFKEELMDFVSSAEWIARFSKKYNTAYFDYITFYYREN